MPACTPDRGNRTPTLRPASCDLTTLMGANVATMPAPRPLATKRRVTPGVLGCLLRFMRFLLGGASVCLGSPEYTSFACRASCRRGDVPRPNLPHTRRGRPRQHVA